MEGQIKQSAAFSITRLIYRDAKGQATARLLTDLKATTNVTRHPDGTKR